MSEGTMSLSMTPILSSPWR